MTDGILLCDDLLFASRIVGEARAHGLTLGIGKSPIELGRILVQCLPRCVIVDLQTPGLDMAELMREIAGLIPKPTMVGFGSHVDTTTLKSAREAGCDVVWPRSKFVEELASALPGWFRQEERTNPCHE
jgi:DNA-binding NarL/FixJ family response regulator